MVSEEWTPERRVAAAFNHEEADRVPIYEGVIETPELNRRTKPVHDDPGLLFFPAGIFRFLSAPFCRPLLKSLYTALAHPAPLAPVAKIGLLQHARLYRQLGVDLIGFVGGLPMVFSPRIFTDFHVERRGDNSIIVGPGGNLVTSVPRGLGAVLRRGFLRDPADYDKYMHFDPDHPANYFMVEPALKAARGKIALVFTVMEAAYFENLCEMFGFEKLFYLLVKDPGFIRRAVKDMSDYAVAVVSRLGEMGVNLVYMTDDLGQKERPMISPRMYRQYFQPGVTRFCRVAHRHGVKVMMHSDGNVMEMVPQFLDAGIDALHPWEGDAGMDIVTGKRQWGKRLTIFGSVPINLLSHGTPRDVVHKVQDLLRECAPGGGYIISSSHSIVGSCRWQNYVAMLWASHKFGCYPIRL